MLKVHNLFIYEKHNFKLTVLFFSSFSSLNSNNWRSQVWGIKIQRECFDNIVKHSHSAAALALNLLDNLIPKELQHISNIKGTNGKTPLNPSILAAIKGNIDFNLPVQKIVRSLFRLTCKYIASRLSMLN